MTVLVHGFYRDKTDMSYLHYGLDSLGFETFVVNLPSTFGTFEDMVDSMALQLKVFQDKELKMNFVAHSMGGLITRRYIQTHPKVRVGSCVFISTPHKGTKLADIAKSKIPWFLSVFRPIKELSSDISYTPFLNKSFKLGLIAGSSNKDILGRIFMPENSDGRVSVESAMSDDADEFIILPFGHDEIHHKEITLKYIVNFLQFGTFKLK
ncbi:hypothetical protein M947_03900 [Sulfurimonas hongkongensis]|uniref:DUF7379 domain-containing protein n=1 Tax=Sulfurimonas hongkongensis TaxID=1172190 RepID=T0JGI4_9BACT|nr:alpha/beta fold hydrolase [Sulfurimonas hongkongensis]EQB40175.1 hypothetical protein M947_03900 [Sulfurimonas hongkongensis]